MGITYHYISFDENGKSSVVDFYEYSGEDEGFYCFEGDEVPKAKWDKLTKKYFDVVKDEVPIKYYEFKIVK